MKLKDYIFERCRERPVYMPYLTIGDPSFDATVRLGIEMIDQGADLLELGIPFSDPTADGPIIQAAMVRAMEHSDFSLARIFETAEQIHRERPSVPLVFLTYLNPVALGFHPEGEEVTGKSLRRSIARFLEECHRVGVTGLVIPDLPHDAPEAEILRSLGEANNVYQVLMVAPSTGKRRLKEISRAAESFIYYVTSLGVTGERKELPTDLKERIALVKRESGVPVIAGFGISRPEQVEPLLGVVDGVIVGSQNHKLIQEKGEGALKEISVLTRGFVEVLKKKPAP